MTAKDHLVVVYSDKHIVVTDKPSCVLCVPGVNDNPLFLTIVHQLYGSDREEEEGRGPCSHCCRYSMIVHRLDMDTSGLVIFTRTDKVLRWIHGSLQDR